MTELAYLLAAVAVLYTIKYFIANQVKHRANNRFDAIAFYKTTNPHEPEDEE